MLGGVDESVDVADTGERYARVNGVAPYFTGMHERMFGKKLIDAYLGQPVYAVHQTFNGICQYGYYLQTGAKLYYHLCQSPPDHRLNFATLQSFGVESVTNRTLDTLGQAGTLSRLTKDTAHSCVFDFPDRPTDQLPSQPPPFYDTPDGLIPIPDFPWPPYDDYPPSDPHSTPPHPLVRPGGPPSPPWPGLIFTCWVSSESIDFYWDVGGDIFDFRVMMGLPAGAILRLHPLQEGLSYWFRAMINSGYIHLFCYIISPNTLNHPTTAGDLSAATISLIPSGLITDPTHTTVENKTFYQVTGIVTVGHLIEVPMVRLPTAEGFLIQGG